MFSRDSFLSMAHPELINKFNIHILHIKYNNANRACQELEKIFFKFFSGIRISPCIPRNTAFVLGKQSEAGDQLKI